MTVRAEKHPDSFLGLADLGTQIPAYRPTFPGPNGYHTDFHRWLARCPLQNGVIALTNGWGEPLTGWLRREDALKLYEIAYATSGDVLELGTLAGLSASILARAKQDQAQRDRVYSVDLSLHFLGQARANLASLGLLRQVDFVCADGVAFVQGAALRGKQFGFVFVDHSHAYAPVYDVCQVLPKIVRPGGFCLFHDFNDVRNRDEQDADYGVYQAVLAGLDRHAFEFYGIYGCTALYRKAPA